MTTRASKTTFTATLALHGKTATGIEVPGSAIEELGAGKKPAVVVAINGASYRTTVASRGDRFLIPVSAENRAVVKVEAGDKVEVELTVDTEPRVVEVPDDLAEALAGEEKAAVFFETLTFAQKKEYARWVTDAKREETRRSRIEKSVVALREGRKQH
ncbi:hypothetical protein BH10ACT11_BH10ACT11_21850 [soil metagenome]